MDERERMLLYRHSLHPSSFIVSICITSPSSLIFDRTRAQKAITSVTGHRIEIEWREKELVSSRV